MLAPPIFAVIGWLLALPIILAVIIIVAVIKAIL